MVKKEHVEDSKVISPMVSRNYVTKVNWPGRCAYEGQWMDR